ncbi:MAG: hypothetical protein ABI873_09970 [Marmoricola sp.]
MSSVTSPRGPLPPRVYWIRRGLLVLFAMLLVFVVGKVLSSFGGNDGGGSARAANVAVSTTSAAPHADATTGAGSAAGTVRPAKRSGNATLLPQSVPTGQCQDSDVTVTSTVTRVAGGGKVALPLELTTTGGACTWRVSSKTVVLKITSGIDRVWSSQDCAASIPTTDVVVRPVGEKAAKVDVTWTGRRSDSGCPSGSAWADPGYYHVTAASLGGAPTDTQFKLAAPPRPTVTKTTHPKPTKKPKSVKTPKG